MAGCDSCGQRFGMGRRPTTTVTGRQVCEPCGDALLAAAAGVVANPGNPVGGAIATGGWFRALRRRKPRAAETTPERARRRGRPRSLSV